MGDASESTIRRFEWDAVPPSVAVVETVSDATGVGPMELPTLNDTIDTDALDALCANSNQDNESVTVSFVYAGCEVTILEDGTVIAESVEADE